MSPVEATSFRGESFSLLSRFLSSRQQPPRTPAPAGTPPAVNFADWWLQLSAGWKGQPSPFYQAMDGGYHAPCVAYAFAAGYQAALRRLVSGLPLAEPVSFAVTEEGGGHPRAIRTALQETGQGIWQVHGAKKWTTLAIEAAHVLVAASMGENAEGRKTFRMVRIPTTAAGLTIEVMPEMSFLPEISHGRMQLDQVRVTPEDILPGDGYEAYIKPFRTIEDIHVNIALLAYVLSVGVRYDWSPGVVERLAALLAALEGLAAGDPADPALQIALGGHLAAQMQFLQSLDDEWSRAPDDVRTHWQRDAALFQIAGKARAQRLETAWQKVRGA